MTIKMQKRITDKIKLKNFDELISRISDSDIKQNLESFKIKLDYTGYYIYNYNEGKKSYNTPSQTHDIALIFRSNAENGIFILKSSLDCLSNALNKIYALQIRKVTFSKKLWDKLENKQQYKIAKIIKDFYNNNEYFFKLRNSITHNYMSSLNFDLELPPPKIKAHLKSLPDCNVPSDSEIGVYLNNMIKKIYILFKNISHEILKNQILNNE